jgi:hypothetical protein
MTTAREEGRQALIKFAHLNWTKEQERLVFVWKGGGKTKAVLLTFAGSQHGLVANGWNLQVRCIPDVDQNQAPNGSRKLE